MVQTRKSYIFPQINNLADLAFLLITQSENFGPAMK